MTHEELIAKQQIEIEEYKSLFLEVSNIKYKLHGMLLSIGQPLNDNILGFDGKQLLWCAKVNELVEQLPE